MGSGPGRLARQMQDLFKKAFQLPPRAPAGKDAKNECVLLPKQSQDELVLSMVHSKLDRVLLFLQREIGYVLLDDARPRLGGGAQLRPHRRPRGAAKGPAVRIPSKADPEAEEREAKRIIRFKTETAQYAHCPDDLLLVWRFASILEEASPSGSEGGENEALCQAVLKGVRLMHLCRYEYSDLVVTLAYASVYFKSTCELIGHKMSDTEAAHVCALLIFLAHCFVIDETCPLRYWQTYIFRDYCTLKMLDAALFRIFEMRDFSLRISSEDEKQALRRLLKHTEDCDVVVTNEAITALDSFSSTFAGPSSSATSPGDSHDESPH